MKIGIDARFLGLEHAGLGRYTTELIWHLLNLVSRSPEKKNIRFVIFTGNNPLPDKIQEILDKNVGLAKIVAVDASHYSWTEQTELPKILGEQNLDLVHFLHFNHPLFYKGKYVATIHDLTLEQFAQKKWPWQKWAYKLTLANAIKKSQKIITVSEFVKGEIIDRYRVSPKKIGVVYNGIDEKCCPITNPRPLKKAMAKYGIGKPFILYVGQQRRHKNLLTLLEAFKMLDEKHEFTDKYQLVFAGKKDPRFPELSERISRLKLSRKAIFTGFVTDQDLSALYNAATIFAFPSFSEGFGLPPLEAMACGTPVIASNATSLPEILGTAAAYFRPDNILDLYQTLTKVLTDGRLRQQMAAAGTKQAAKYSWQKTAEQTLAIYKSV